MLERHLPSRRDDIRRHPGKLPAPALKTSKQFPTGDETMGSVGPLNHSLRPQKRRNVGVDWTMWDICCDSRELYLPADLRFPRLFQTSLLYTCFYQVRSNIYRDGCVSGSPPTNGKQCYGHVRRLHSSLVQCRSKVDIVLGWPVRVWTFNARSPSQIAGWQYIPVFQIPKMPCFCKYQTDFA